MINNSNYKRNIKSKESTLQMIYKAKRANNDSQKTMKEIKAR